MKLKNKPFLLGIIISIPFAISIGFYYFLYPIFNITKINNEYKIELKREEKESDININDNIIYFPNSPVIGGDKYTASGTAGLILTPDQNIIRFEDLQTIDDKDIKVYLSKSIEKREDSILLGNMKSSKGDVNYKIPNPKDDNSEINFDEYKYVIHWGESSNILFNYVKLK